jgi:hypothetical protein
LIVDPVFSAEGRWSGGINLSCRAVRLWSSGLVWLGRWIFTLMRVLGVWVGKMDRWMNGQDELVARR